MQSLQVRARPAAVRACAPVLATLRLTRMCVQVAVIRMSKPQDPSATATIVAFRGSEPFIQVRMQALCRHTGAYSQTGISPTNWLPRCDQARAD